jgi:hypothetical protein
LVLAVTTLKDRKGRTSALIRPLSSLLRLEIKRFSMKDQVLENTM